MATQILYRGGRPIALRLPAYELRMRAAAKGEKITRFEQPVVRVGSSAGNDLVIEDPAVSRIHFEIAADADGFRLTDLGSTNGTFVDGYRAACIYLKPGSTIVLGQSEIRFVPLEESSELALAPSDAFGAVIGRSTAMREVFVALERVALTDFTLLIEGESGVGKEVIAQALHEASPRARGPFEVFDCAAAPANLIESQLFGHEAGAFTGATSRRIGAVESADGGTLFLDEIGELPLELQPKLLRCLETRQVRRLGGQEMKSIDVRIVCATNRDLAAEINRGFFRHDLYYRIAVVRLRIPPLRERPEDIPLLFEHFAKNALPDQRADQFIGSISEASWARLTTYPFRGNARELRNLVQRTVALADWSKPAKLELDFGVEPRATPPAPVATGVALPPVDLNRPFGEQKAELIAHFEEEYLRGMLDKHGSKIARASAAAGLDRMYFKRLLKKYS